MKEGFCLVRFLDGQKLLKVAPLEYVRCADTKLPFKPKSSMDMPKGKIQVKWQRSVMAENFTDDGFYDAEVLAISRGFETLLAKAKEQGLRLPPCPMIQLPGKSVLDAEEAPSKRKARKRTSSGSSATSVTNRNSLENTDKESKERKTNEAIQTNNSKGKAKPNKTAKDPVRRDRLLKTLVDATSNPLMCSLQDKKESEKNLKNTNMMTSGSKQSLDRKASELEKGSCSSTAQSKNQIIASDGLSAKYQNYSKSTSNSNILPSISVGSKKQDAVSPDLFNSPTHEIKESTLSVVASPNPKAFIVSPLPSKVKRSLWSSELEEISPKTRKVAASPLKTSSPLSQNLFPSPKFSVEKTRKQDTDYLESDEDSLESTLPIEVRDIPCVSSSSSDASDESDEDIAGQLVETQKELKLVKEKLMEAESQVTLSNNLRIKYKEKAAKLECDISTLKREGDELKAQILKLRERNEWLQDMLMSKGPAKDVGIGKKSIFISDDEPIRTSNAYQMRNEIATLEDGDETDEVKNASNSDNQNELYSVIDETLEKKSQEKKPQESQRKSKGKIMDLQSENLAEACSRVLNHLTKKEELAENESGQINIGNNVFVKKSAFEKNFMNNKLDMIAATRNLACLTWTKTERVERSLEGGSNNKNAQQAAKKMATPLKVQTVLGAVKAHMLYQGDSDGPRMTQTLQSCRKAIGTKFAQDAYNVLRGKKD